MATYKNPWHKENSSDCGPAFYTTDAKPVERGGYLIYNRIKGARGRGVWDVVLNGVCINQFAGPDCKPHTGARASCTDYQQWLRDIGAVAA